MSSRRHFLEVDESLLHVGMNQLYANPVADIKALKPVFHAFAP